YAQTVDWLVETRGGNTVTAIQSIFDVDFGSGMIDNFFLRICVDGTSGCNGATVWESEGSPGGYFSAGFLEPFSVYGFIDRPEGEDGLFHGYFGGRFAGRVGEDEGEDSYKAFLAAFNLYEDNDETGSYLSGLFLSEREDRFSSSYWEGGSKTILDMMFEPTRGILQEQGGPLQTGLIGHWREDSEYFEEDYYYSDHEILFVGAGD